MFIRFAALGAALAAVLVLGIARPMAHDGHDHGPLTPVVTSVAPRMEANSGAFELVAIQRGETLEIWLDRQDTNQPVVDATIEVETPKGPVKAVATPNGGYQLAAPWAFAPGSYDLAFTIQQGKTIDILAGTLAVPQAVATGAGTPSPMSSANLLLVLLLGLGLGGSVTLAVIGVPHLRRPALTFAVVLAAAFGVAQLVARENPDKPSAAEAFNTRPDRSQILGDGSVFLPKSTQRILELRTLVAREDQHKKRIELPGRVIADPNASGLVQASTAGRLSPPPGGFPRLGARVQAGDILAFVTSPYMAIDQSTMRQQAGDLDQQIAIIERRVARNETLAKTGSVAQATLDESRLELKGLTARRSSLDKVKREPEALRAPVDGIIASANAVAGQVADPNTSVFQIVDPSKLFVEALAFENPPAGLAASGRTVDGRALSLDYVGAGFADRNQAVPVDFAIRDSAGLRLGQFVSVLAETPDVTTGLAVPRGSVVRRSNGESIVFEHVNAERFEARAVRVQPLDAERVLILGLPMAGPRVVSQAAELLNQVR